MAVVLGGLATGAIAQEHWLGFLDVNGTITTIAVPGAFDTQANGINNAGQIVGSFTLDSRNPLHHGFLYTGGAFRTIDVPGAFETQATGINNAGQIVGGFAGDRGIRGFLYAGGTFSTIEVPETIRTEATGINDAGQIVGFVQVVPEPDSLVLFSVGLLGLGLAWRRRVAASTLLWLAVLITTRAVLAATTFVRTALTA